MLANLQSLLTIAVYAAGISVGVLGLGAFLWDRMARETSSVDDRSSAGTWLEHPLLSIGISWFLGYFVFEGVLTLLSVLHLFQPAVVLGAGGVLTLGGYYGLSRRWGTESFRLNLEKFPWLDRLLLAGLCGFVLFWNLYPSFDVDSLAFYFRSVQRFLEYGGRTFSPYTDVRINVPQGENMLYALGFAIWPRGTLFPQLVHGLSKIMFLLGAYGAARTLGCRRLALLAPILIAADEHWLTSGANSSVRINMQLTMGLFLLGSAGVIGGLTARRKYLLLACLAGCCAVSCKFLGILYLGCAVMVFVLMIWALPSLRASLKMSWSRQPITILMMCSAAVFTAIPYLYNWLATGTPFFPASLGPGQSSVYDQAVQEVASRWHYRLSWNEAMKNISAFLVWPGILASKILLPLVAASSLAALISAPENRKYFQRGLVFLALSLTVIMLHEMYMVFEMRYYRYGIGLYALASCLFLTFLFQVPQERHQLLKRAEPVLSFALLIAMLTFSLRASFAGMGASRPSAQDVMDFISGTKSESQIMTERLGGKGDLFAALQKLSSDHSAWAYLLSFQWPHAIYPLEGRSIGFLISAAFPSETYFNEGLVADALLKEKIRFLFNQVVSDKDYPLPGGAFYPVLELCGHPMVEGNKEFLALSEACLQDLAQKKDRSDAIKRLHEAMTVLRSEPPYSPFLPPPYGGPSGVIR